MDQLIDLSEDVFVSTEPAVLPSASSSKAASRTIDAPTPSRMPFLNDLLVSARSSFDSNPFDQVLHQAEGYDDPFECLHQMAKQSNQEAPAKPDLATGTLIQIDSPVSSVEVKIGMKTKVTKELASEKQDVGKVDNKPGESQSGKSGRLHSDSDISSLLKSIKTKSPSAGKSRSNSLDQLVRRNQLLKLSIANSSINAFSPRSPAAPPATSSPLPSAQNTPEKANGRTSRDESFDNLMDTSPHWIDSEADESDIDTMCIPFLQESGSPTAAAQQISTASNLVKPKAQKGLSMDRGQLVEHLDRQRSTASPPAMPVLVEETEPIVQPPQILVTADPSADENLDQLASLLQSVKLAIEKCDNNSEAKAMLANLNSVLHLPNQDTEAEPKSPADVTAPNVAQDACHLPTPIIRQGTFNLEDRSPTGSSASSVAPSAQVSPNTNVANVVEQLGLMNLNQQFSVLQNLNHLIAPNGKLKGIFIILLPWVFFLS